MVSQPGRSGLFCAHDQFCINANDFALMMGLFQIATTDLHAIAVGL